VNIYQPDINIDIKNIAPMITIVDVEKNIESISGIFLG
jgi:hypothetical protein